MKEAANLDQCYDWIGIFLLIKPVQRVPCVGNYIQISHLDKVCWKTAIVSCNALVKQHGPEPMCLIWWGKQYRNNRNHGHLKITSERLCPSCKRLDGKKITWKIFASLSDHSIGHLQQFNDAPVLPTDRNVANNCLWQVPHSQPKWLRAVNFPSNCKYCFITEILSVLAAPTYFLHTEK